MVRSLQVLLTLRVLSKVDLIFVDHEVAFRLFPRVHRHPLLTCVAVRLAEATVAQLIMERVNFIIGGVK